MLKIRKSDQRGHANHGWLDTYHTFSFADYYDPEFMGFSVLRVINQDIIAAGTGFGMHGHRDMEIITYVVKGALFHKDSMGNETIIRPGEVQRMSAGSGIKHSEYNHEKASETHLFQIWISPIKKNSIPSYDQKSFSEALSSNGIILVASPTGKENSVSLDQDVNMYVGKPKIAGVTLFNISTQRNIWIQLITGNLDINGNTLSLGDGAQVTQTENLKLKWTENSEFLIFDLP
jgi:redox-sensitive bicupin YhaK (pirin superfamily)